MEKLFYSAILILLIISCGGRESGVQTATITDSDLEMDSLPRRIAVNSRASEILKNWPEFNTLESSFDALYNAENREDLILIMEDFVERQKVMEASEYPKEFDKSQIKSRQKVLKTYILKAKAALEYRTDILEPIKEMVEAYNALRKQFNVIVNSTLETNVILDE